MLQSEDRPGVICPGGNCVEHLACREPMELLYEVGAKKGEHHVAAAEDDHAELEELDRDLAQPWSSGGV